ncbi:septation protein SepH [Nocardioides bruguierae]|uniref:septation protein SepH n=1 Tax=Nocardioides bruguierae TaxID=2945102 RepID=UPI00202195F3|nr:septation protein SepH [Nocardioides bruguierae]MCL8024339.1 septation protein SepH [Nocardioides bruguierae]
MVHLTLAGISGDGKQLLLVSEAGVRFTVDNDSRLRAALSGDTASQGQLEITMDSALRPREIQARIRAGETPEAVAEAARTSVERIQPYAGPVLAEREHMAQRAQRSSVRGREAEGPRILGRAVTERLSGLGLHSDVVSWDSWRREDGRWVLVGEFATPDRTGMARFTFDPPGNYVVMDNDEAKWLIGEPLPEPEPARDDLRLARERRLAAAQPSDDEPLEFVASMEAYLDVPTDAADAPARPAAEPEAPEDAVVEPPADPVAEPAEPAVQESSAPEPVAETPAADEPAEEPTKPARRPSRKRGRASVPSWDEIMFGNSQD